MNVNLKFTRVVVHKNETMKLRNIANLAVFLLVLLLISLVIGGRKKGGQIAQLPPIVEFVAVDNYGKFPSLPEIESRYMSSMRSCLGVHCFDQLVDDGTARISRVGLLSVPKSGAETILWLLSVACSKADFAKIQVVKEAHVPPYGYGKNHGWSSIVRLSRGLFQHSYSLLHPSDDNHTLPESSQTINSQLYANQVSKIPHFFPCIICQT